MLKKKEKSSSSSSNWNKSIRISLDSSHGWLQRCGSFSLHDRVIDLFGVGGKGSWLRRVNPIAPWILRRPALDHKSTHSAQHKSCFIYHRCSFSLPRSTHFSFLCAGRVDGQTASHRPLVDKSIERRWELSDATATAVVDYKYMRNRLDVHLGTTFIRPSTRNGIDESERNLSPWHPLERRLRLLLHT